MILFYEDDKKALPTKKKKIIGRIVKVLLALAFLVFLSLAILSSLSKYKEPLRLGIQDYLNHASGYISEVGFLEEMSFFPATSIKFSDLSFYRPLEKPEEERKRIEEDIAQKKKAGEVSHLEPHNIEDAYYRGDKVAYISQAHIAMGFWDILLSRKRFYDLSAKGIVAEKGVWFPHKLVIDAISVEHEDEEKHWLLSKGVYGDHSFSFTIGLQRHAARAGKYIYEVPKDTDFSFILGPVSLKGIMHSTKTQGLRISVESFSVNDFSVSGDVRAKKVLKGLDLGFDLKTAATDMDAQLSRSASGESDIDITFRTLEWHELKSAYQAYGDLMEILGFENKNDKVSFGAHDRDFHIKVDRLTQNGKDLGHFELSALTKPYQLEINRLAGLINGGAVSGTMMIDATGKTPSLSAKGSWKGWDYARLQDKVTGQADTHFSLKSEGQTFPALRKGLVGEIVTIAGEGEFSGSSILYWGTGLLNAMLPKLSDSNSLKMNCMIADFDVKDSIATAQTLFMDLSDLTIVGEGTININDFTLDLTLKPDPKNLSLIDTGVAVNITGSISHARISPDRFSMGKKLGGLLLGTLNPVFFAFSLTDLGLNEKHPCVKHMKAE